MDQVQEFVQASQFKKKPVEVLFHGQCALSALPVDANIYVLGHGIDLRPDGNHRGVMQYSLLFHMLESVAFGDWAFSVSGGLGAVAIDTVAERMMADGLSALEQASIKLWFCDPNNKAAAMAKKFQSRLDGLSGRFRIDYYPGHTLYNPSIHRGVMRKWVLNEKENESEPVRASQIRQSFFTPDNENAEAREVWINMEGDPPRHDMESYIRSMDIV